VAFKSFSCCGSNFTSLEALSQIMQDHSLFAAEIQKITVHCASVTKLHVGWDYRPEGITSAQMNLPYCLAVMALAGEVSVDQFTEEKIKDPAILDFIKRVEVVPEKELDRLGPDYRHAILCEVEMNDGRSFHKRIDFAKGGPSNPLTPQEVEMKFYTLARKVLPEGKVQSLYHAIQNVESLPSLVELTCNLTP
jgi:2-methylcitrate dehydratase PrpD